MKTSQKISPCILILARIFVVASMIVMPLLAGLSLLPSQAQTKAPYNKEQLLEALKANSQSKEFTATQLVEYIEQRGVDFELTAKDEVVFRRVGARPEVILAIRRNYHPPTGSLTIIPNIPGAAVNVNGISYPEGVNGLAMTPGTYEVRVSAPGYKTETRIATIRPKQSQSLPISLQRLPIEEMLILGKQSLAQSNYRQAIAICKEILLAKPDDPQATLLLGITYFYAGEYSECVPYLTKSLSQGEQVVLPIQHHTKTFGVGDDLCRGRLTIGKGSVAFQSDGRCKGDFIVPYNKVYSVKLEPNIRGGRISLKVGIPKETKVDKKGKRVEQEDKKDINFHPIQATLQSPYPNALVEVHCFNCLASVQAIYELLQYVTQKP